MTAKNLTVTTNLEAAPVMPVLRPPLLVFHINDNTDDQVLFQAACKKADVPFQWHVAESAERGVSYFNSLLNLSQTQTVRWPDLVVLDLVMPGGSGLMVLDFIRATAKLQPLPVVVLTGHPSDELQAAAAKAGANGFYQKPLDFGQLVELVRSLYSIWSAAQRPKL
jgi:DNA-binding response OmpR family regulator